MNIYQDIQLVNFYSFSVMLLFSTKCFQDLYPSKLILIIPVLKAELCYQPYNSWDSSVIHCLWFNVTFM